MNAATVNGSREKLQRWALAALAFYLCTRPLAEQFEPYDILSGFVALGLLAAAVLHWLAGRNEPEHGSPAAALTLCCILWSGLLAMGLLRSPHLGEAIPQTTQAFSGLLLFWLCHRLAVRSDASVKALLPLLPVLGCVLSFYAGWMKYHELPRLSALLDSGLEPLADVLRSQAVRERIASSDIPSTFGNANSFAAYLLTTIFVQLGMFRQRIVCAGGFRTKSMLVHGALLVIQGWGLWLSDSKGGWVAGLLALCIFILLSLPKERWSGRHVGKAIAAGVLLLVAILGGATFGWLLEEPFGASMVERFNYWRAGWAMWLDEPLTGVGTAGYAENYALYKLPLGTEVRSPHNDWLLFLVEFGICGPLVWGLFWVLILRNSSTKEAVRQTQHEDRTRVLIPGLYFAGLFILVITPRLNASDLLLVLQGSFDERSILAGAGACCALVVVFVCALRALRHVECARSTITTTNSIPCFENIGMRTAIVAILLHQLVDFDFLAQGVQAHLFLLGGFVAGRAQANAAVSEPIAFRRAAQTYARIWHYAVPLLAIVLVYPAVYLPVQVGLLRADAVSVQRDFDEAYRASKTEPSRSKVTVMLESLQAQLQARTRAVALASFDANLHLERARTLAQLVSLVPEAEPMHAQLQDQTIEALQQVANRRPRWAGIYFELGHQYFRLGFRTKRQTYFIKAKEYYLLAQRYYPLHPGYLIGLGDLALLQGMAAEAVEYYERALALDRQLVDLNVCFAGIFVDSYPGCLPRHGLSGEVLEVLVADDRSVEKSELLVRRILALAEQGGTPFDRLEEVHRLLELAPDDAYALTFYAAAYAVDATTAENWDMQWEAALRAAAVQGLPPLRLIRTLRLKAAQKQPQFRFSKSGAVPADF